MKDFGSVAKPSVRQSKVRKLGCWVIARDGFEVKGRVDRAQSKK